MGFGGYLQANTAVDILIGPFVDDTDGKTAETGLTIDVELSKNGQALANKSDATSPVHDAAGDIDGYYNCELDTTDTNTEGTLTVVCFAAGALPCRHDFMVLSQAAYISLVTAKDAGFMDVNIKTVGRADTQETEANNLESACANYSATRGLTGTAVPAAAADAAGGLAISDAGGIDLDAIKAMTDKIGTIVNTGGTATIGAVLGDFANSSLVTRVADLHTDVADVHTDVGTAISDIAATHVHAETIETATAAGAIATSVWNAATATYGSAGSYGLLIETNLDAVLSDLHTDIGTVHTDVDAILADTGELQTDWVNGGRLDLLIDAIKTQTDKFTFTVAGQVDANVQSVNDAALTGNGSALTPWGPV